MSIHNLGDPKAMVSFTTSLDLKGSKELFKDFCNHVLGQKWYLYRWSGKGSPIVIQNRESSFEGEELLLYFNGQFIYNIIPPAQMKIYKFRAECFDDFSKIFYVLGLNDASRSFFFNPIQEGFPDIEGTFESRLSLEEIKGLIKEVEDLHVILETIALESEYTGDRLPLASPEISNEA